MAMNATGIRWVAKSEVGLGLGAFATSVGAFCSLQRHHSCPLSPHSFK